MTGESERREENVLRSALSGTRFGVARWVSETGSTNDDLAAVARDGGPEQVLVTDLQTAGRGRRGRVWDAPPRSSVLMSLLIRDRSPSEGFWAVGAVALAAAETIDAMTVASASLKWPNDVLLAERKVAGVLAAVVDKAVIVGIGINVNWPTELPPELQDRAASVNHHLRVPGDVDRGAFAADIVQRTELILDLSAGDLRQRWLGRCATIGNGVRVERDGAQPPVTGIAVDVDPDGALVVEADGVRRSHHVGEVVHLRPA